MVSEHEAAVKKEIGWIDAKIYCEFNKRGTEDRKRRKGLEH